MKVTLFVISLSILMFQSLHTASAVEACDEYVDGVIRDLKEDKEYFQDPYNFEDKTVAVHKKMVFINYTGEASIYDGHIYGLSSLHRDGEVVVDRNKRTHLKIWLGAGELNMQCKGKVKLMGHGPQVSVEAKVVYVNMKLDVVPTTKGNNPKIQNFKIEEVKGDEVTVSGLGPLNFFANQYIKIIGTLFRNIIKNGIETRMKSFLAKKLKEYEIPEDCIGEDSRRSLYFR